MMLLALVAVAVMGCPGAGVEPEIDETSPSNGTITGTVTIDGSPAANALVFIGNEFRRTGVDGTFTVANLQHGEYEVELTEFPPEATFASTRQTVVIDSDNLIGRAVFAGTTANASIGGRVSVEGFGPLPGVTVTLSGGASATAVTDNSGRYNFVGVQPGEYEITIDGYGPHQFETTTRGLTINAKVQVDDLDFRGSFGLWVPLCRVFEPSFAAFLDSDGNWVGGQLNADGSVSVPVDVGVGGGGLAYGGITEDLVEGEVKETRIIRYGSGEAVRLHELTCPLGEGRNTVVAQVTGLESGQRSTVFLGGSDAFLVGSSDAFLSVGAGDVAGILNDVPNGRWDLFANRWSFDFDNAAPVVDAFVRRNDVDAAVGSLLPPIDFDTEGFQPEVRTVTVNGREQGGTLFISPQLLLRDGSSHEYSPDRGTAAVDGFVAIPEERRMEGDFHRLEASSTDFNQGTTRTAARTFGIAVDQTLTLGEQLANVTIGTGDDGITVQLPVQPEYEDGLRIELKQPDASRRTFVEITEAARNGTGEWAFTMPDLGAVTGFDAGFELQQGQEIEWEVRAFGWDLGGGRLLAPPRIEGAEDGSAGRSGTIPG